MRAFQSGGNSVIRQPGTKGCTLLSKRLLKGHQLTAGCRTVPVIQSRKIFRRNFSVAPSSSPQFLLEKSPNKEEDKKGQKMTIKLYLIAAACENRGIGYKNDLPWRLKNEMAYFNRMTTTTEKPGSINAVLMGRRTWESIPPKYRPLKGRLNVVLSSSADAKSLEITENELLFPSWEEAIKGLEACQEAKGIEKVWVIGGSSIYKMGVESPLCERIYLTRIFKTFECDTFFPEFDKSKFQLVFDPEVPEQIQEENGIEYKFEVYERVQE